MRNMLGCTAVVVAMAISGCKNKKEPTGAVGAAEPSAASSETTVEAGTTASAAPAAAPSKATPEPNRLEGVRHHALIQKKVGFYGVLLPEGYDADERRYPVVVILHGSGSTEEAHGHLANKFGREGVIYVLPRAPHAHQSVFFEKQQPGWTAWPSYPEEWGKRDGPKFPKEEVDDVDPKGLYVEWIVSTIRDARARYRTTDEGAVVFGHSQGASFAHELAIQHPDMLKAYFAYAGYYDSTTEHMADAAHSSGLKKQGVAIAIAHHEKDELVKFEHASKLVDYFKRHGVNHEAHLLSGGAHTVTPEVRQAAGAFVRKWCCGDAKFAKD